MCRSRHLLDGPGSTDVLFMESNDSSRPEVCGGLVLVHCVVEQYSHALELDVPQDNRMDADLEAEITPMEAVQTQHLETALSRIALDTLLDDRC